MTNSKHYDVEVSSQIDGVAPSSAKFSLDHSKACEIVRLSEIVKTNNLHKVEQFDSSVDYEADFEIAAETLSVSSTEFWFTGHAKSSGAIFETEQLSIAEVAQHFGIEFQAGSEVSEEVFPGATKYEITSVMMQDIVGDYDVPDTVPEWGWVERNACFNHSKNGEHGIWEFVLNLACSWNDIPEKLAPVISAVRANNAAYLIIHQGT